MKKLLALMTTLLILMFFAGCSNTNVISVQGKFYHTIELTDIDENEDTYYQFRSNDNEVWWLLTASEIGFIPDTTTEYTLTYNNNGTTKYNKSCDCLEEWDCECEVYDDVFISLK